MKRFPADVQCLRLLILLFSSPVSPLFDETDDARLNDPESSSSLGENAEAFLCRGCGGQVYHTSHGFVRRSSPFAFATYPLSTVDPSGKGVNVTARVTGETRR